MTRADNDAESFKKSRLLMVRKMVVKALNSSESGKKSALTMLKVS
jgi:hypothetical protein